MSCAAFAFHSSAVADSAYATRYDEMVHVSFE